MADADADAKARVADIDALDVLPAAGWGVAAGSGAGAQVAGEAGVAAPAEANTAAALEIDGAMEAVAERMEQQGEPLDLKAFDEQERLEISPPSDLQRRYERYPKELRPSSPLGLVLTSTLTSMSKSTSMLTHPLLPSQRPLRKLRQLL